MAQPAAVLPDPLQEAFAVQLRLCRQLEDVADSLPARLDRQLCLHLSRLVGPVVRQAHAAEEKHLFPAVKAGLAHGPAVVERLRLEHMEDECFAEEVQHELMRLGRGDPSVVPEATGYMLRGFFEGIRRHIHHEAELLGVDLKESARR